MGTPDGGGEGEGGGGEGEGGGGEGGCEGDRSGSDMVYSSPQGTGPAFSRKHDAGHAREKFYFLVVFLWCCCQGLDMPSASRQALPVRGVQHLGDDDEDADGFRLEDLPPLPRPNTAVMRSEACTGITVVLVLITLLVGVPHALRFGSGWQWPAAGEPFDSTAACFLCLYVESTIALLCLLGLIFGDPGVLKRSRESCFPIPPAVLERLRSGQSLTGMDNVYSDGHVYCIRCCMWRHRRRTSRNGGAFCDNNEDENIHHCSVCQRCVRHFDHHCGVFGRCIAGDGCRGNMGYFKMILTMALAGFMTCFAAIAQ